jgi:hypothetical protein
VCPGEHNHVHVNVKACLSEDFKLQGTKSN